MQYLIYNTQTGLYIKWGERVILFSKKQDAVQFMRIFENMFDEFSKIRVNTTINTEDEEAQEDYIMFEDIPDETIQRELKLIDEEAVLQEGEWLVPIRYELCGVIKVKANSPEEACRMVWSDPEGYQKPNNAVYSNDSVSLVSDLDESIAISQRLSERAFKIGTKDINEDLKEELFHE